MLRSHRTVGMTTMMVTEAMEMILLLIPLCYMVMPRKHLEHTQIHAHLPQIQVNWHQEQLSTFLICLNTTLWRMGALNATLTGTMIMNTMWTFGLALTAKAMILTLAIVSVLSAETLVPSLSTPRPILL